MSRAQGSGGLGGNTRCCVHLSGSHSATPRTEPGVTELSGLTSDPVLTADRRGGILISFGLHRTPFEGINPSKGVRGESNSPRKPAAETELNGLPCRSLSAFHPSALYHLRASDRLRAGGRFRPAVRIPFESRLTDKPVDSRPLCALVTRFLRPVLGESSLTDSQKKFLVPKRYSRGSGEIVPRVGSQCERGLACRVRNRRTVSRGWRPTPHPTRARPVESGVWPRTRFSCRRLKPVRISSRDALRAPRGVRSPVSRRWPR